MSRRLLLGISAALITAVSIVPAAAQVGDFFCSTLSIGCEPPPPPPAPVLAPAPEVEKPAKKVRHARKPAVKRTAKADSEKSEAAAK